jgi:hypothetical protein
MCGRGRVFPGERERRNTKTRFVAGGRGLRTYRRTFPAASGSSGIFDDRGRLDGPRIVADSIRSLSEIPRDGDWSYPFTAGCDGFESKVSPPTASAWVPAVRALKARREVQSTVLQRFLARKNTVLRAGGGARPCLQTHGNGQGKGDRRRPLRNCLGNQAEIFAKVRERSGQRRVNGGNSTNYGILTKSPRLE